MKVRAFARSADKLEPRRGLEPFPGDARAPADVARALEDVSAVIYALGIRETSRDALGGGNAVFRNDAGFSSTR